MSLQPNLPPVTVAAFWKYVESPQPVQIESVVPTQMGWNSPKLQGVVEQVVHLSPSKNRPLSQINGQAFKSKGSPLAEYEELAGIALVQFRH
jgi:hypothetical protein